MDKILITILITTCVMFVGLFAMWGGFAAPSLYLAMNIGLLSLVASVPLSIFLVMNNSFWGSVNKRVETSTPFDQHSPYTQGYQPKRARAKPLLVKRHPENERPSKPEPRKSRHRNRL